MSLQRLSRAARLTREVSTADKHSWETQLGNHLKCYVHRMQHIALWDVQVLGSSYEEIPQERLNKSYSSS